MVTVFRKIKVTHFLKTTSSNLNSFHFCFSIYRYDKSSFFSPLKGTIFTVDNWKKQQNHRNINFLHGKPFIKNNIYLNFLYFGIKHENDNYLKISMEIANVYLHDLYFHSVIKEKIIKPICYEVTSIDWI